jgi:hypothetical protein
MKINKMIKKLIKKVPTAKSQKLSDIECRLRLLYDFKIQS